MDRGLHPHHLEGHENAHGGECEKHGPRHGHGPNPDLRFVLFTLRVKSRRPLQRDNPADRRRPNQPHAEREEYGSSNNPGVSSANKTALGLNPKTSTPQPITAPTTNPLLMLQSCSNVSAYVRYRDSAASVSVKAKPYGVTQCQVFGMTAATPVTDPTTLPLLASPTKSPFHTRPRARSGIPSAGYPLGAMDR